MRSDNEYPASDATIREITRRLVDSAPAAPDWHTLQNPNTSNGTTPSSNGISLLLVFAVTVMLITGFWWLRGPTEQVPANVPDVVPSTTATASPLEPGPAWRRWVLATDPLAVQLCIAQTRSNLTASSEVAAINPNEGLPGYSVDAGQLVWHRPTQLQFAAIAAHSGSTPEQHSALTEVTEAFRAADNGQFDDAGNTSTGFVLLIDEYLRVRSDALVDEFAKQPCWPEELEGEQFSPTDPNDAVEALGCLAVAQLDHALWASSEGAPEWDPLVDAAALSLLLQFQTPNQLLAELTAEIRDSIAFGTWDEPMAAAAHAELTTIDVQSADAACPIASTVGISESPDDHLVQLND